MTNHFTGLIAAVFSPMHPDGTLRLEQVGPLVDCLIRLKVAGLFVAGSTGEGPSLTADERRSLAAAYVEAVAGKLPVIVQVGHNSLTEAESLAAHARQIGADAVSSLPPWYFKPRDAKQLAQCLMPVAQAADPLPFYYYHIPKLTGVSVDVAELLHYGAECMPTLCGVKYSEPDLPKIQKCIALDDGRFDVLFGCDEALLAGLATGVQGAVGSTYNFAAPLYRRLWDAFQRGELKTAQAEQLKAVRMVELLAESSFLGAAKAVMASLGVDCGPVRPPLENLDDAQRQSIVERIESLGVLE